MEKLQKALHKARMERDAHRPAQTPNLRAQTQMPAAEPLAPPPPQVQPERDSSALWEELPPYEPNPDHLEKNLILTLNSTSDSTPFDMLRTKAFLLMRQNGWKRLAITSPNQSCGKTTTACNLAVGFSRQRENRTMLFDLDLRRPNVANLLGRKPEHGIKQMVLNDVTPSDQMLCLRGNVALSMTRGPVSDSTQLLLSQMMDDKIDELQAAYQPDVMIFDLPPMFTTDDARAFLKNVDCALIVARAEHTKMGQLDRCEQEVAEQTNVLGIVLNNCRYSDDDDQGYGDYE